MPVYNFAIADVFAERKLSGNPVAVVFDADDLSSEQMQSIAAEFNYVETTFVLSPEDRRNTARVRIFTPDREVPFAGHPNIGTAFLLARRQPEKQEGLAARFVFEEKAGLVVIDLLHEGERIVGAELLSPEPLSALSIVDAGRAAACLGLDVEDVRTDGHPPQVASVGLPFLLVELESRAALANARPNRAAYDRLFPLDGARAVYAYVREQDGDVGCDIHSRMFTWRLVEDPATGSATGAATALLARLRGRDISLRVRQGQDMGRPSDIATRSVTEGGEIRVRVAGRCAQMFSGTFELD